MGNPELYRMIELSCRKYCYIILFWIQIVKVHGFDLYSASHDWNKHHTEKRLFSEVGKVQMRVRDKDGKVRKVWALYDRTLDFEDPIMKFVYCGIIAFVLLMIMAWCLQLELKHGKDIEKKFLLLEMDPEQEARITAARKDLVIDVSTPPTALNKYLHPNSGYSASKKKRKA